MCLIINTGILVSPIYDRTHVANPEDAVIPSSACAKSLRLRLLLRAELKPLELYTPFQSVDKSMERVEDITTLIGCFTFAEGTVHFYSYRHDDFLLMESVVESLAEVGAAKTQVCCHLRLGPQQDHHVPW
jgi:hypothetical protein